MNDKKLWFKAKRYGWGWYPVSVEGAVILILYIALIIPLFLFLDANSHSGSDTLINFAVPFIALTTALLSICYAKGEHPSWHWGPTIPLAPKILREIRKANSILLHCHPSPDPDSVGSALATKFALESLGKKVTVIRGDSEIPKGFMHFPGVKDIVEKDFSEIDLKDFDLFIILDSGSPGMISRKNTPVFPLPLKTIIIDHHSSNKGYADINFIDTAPSTTYVLYKLFREWNIKLTEDIATNIFMGIYTDSGAFKYPPMDYKVFEVLSELTRVAPHYAETILQMENSQEKDAIYGQALALSSLTTFCNDSVVISAITHKSIVDKNISPSSMSEGHIANVLKSVIGWNIGVAMLEVEPGKVKMSFRTRDPNTYDVSKLAVELGGGGHKGAAGATLTASIPEAEKKVVETIKMLYNL